MTRTLALTVPRVRKVLAQAPHLARTLALVWRSAPGWTAAWAVLLVFQGVLPVATVLLSRSVVDRVVAALRSGGQWPALRGALLAAGAIAAVALAAEVLRSVSGYIRTAQSELVQDHIARLIHDKSAAIDLSFYDSAEFYDHLHRARAESSYRPVALLENSGSLVQNGITLMAMGAVLLPFGAWIPMLLLAGTLPALFVALRYTLLHHEWRRRITSEERRTWYYDWLLTAAETAPELRLFHLGDHFQDAFAVLRGRLRGQRRALARRQSLAEIAAGGFGLMVSGAVVLWMLGRAVRGSGTLGDVVLFYQAFRQGLQLMSSLLHSLGQLYGNVLFVGNLFEFLDLRSRVVSVPLAAAPPARLREGLRFRHVTFRYAESRHNVLEDFNLFLPAGKTSAVVGVNGAGKSTLVKLLARFYDPDAGAVEWDGVDARSFGLAELRSRLTVLFQQPVHYNASVRETIVLGDLRRSITDSELRQASLAAGADRVIEGLAEGYDSLLGKWFADGAELSLGEWQRIALARAFVRRAPVLVLDEPTSAMDPWAESDWLARFRELSRGYTVLIITHRFSTALCADAIHVMDGGRIVESGSHLELLRQGGRYAAAWDGQVRPVPAAAP